MSDNALMVLKPDFILVKELLGIRGCVSAACSDLGERVQIRSKDQRSLFNFNCEIYPVSAFFLVIFLINFLCARSLECVLYYSILIYLSIYLFITIKDGFGNALYV